MAHPLLPVRPSRSLAISVPSLVVCHSWTERFVYGLPGARVLAPHWKQAVVLVAALA